MLSLKSSWKGWELINLFATDYQLFSFLSPDGVQVYRDGQDTAVLLFPLYHIGGLSSSLLAGYYLGTTFVTFPKFDFVNNLEAMQKYKVSTRSL